jgi:ribosome-associated toxin RatA of RatAB toxin-antitoxin module
MAEIATETAEVNASLKKCWNVVMDIEKYPEWIADIKEVRILSTDDEGRPDEVSFRAAAFGRSTNYTLKYDYSGVPNTLKWVQLNGDHTNKLDGSYTFEESGSKTTITYELEAELKIPIPGFIKRRAETLIINSALRDLKARAESN